MKRDQNKCPLLPRHCTIDCRANLRGGECQAPFVEDKVAILSEPQQKDLIPMLYMDSGVLCEERGGECCNPTCLLHSRCVDFITREAYQKQLIRSEPRDEQVKEEEQSISVNQLDIHEIEALIEYHKNRIIVFESELNTRKQ